jgi:hypothetical protein
LTEIETLALGAGATARRTANGIVLEFPVLRAPGAALCLGAFALLCGVMPALGLSALLPLDSSNASAMVSLALIGGFAAPFILASMVFATLAIYLMANSLRVEIDAGSARNERRVFGYVTQTAFISRSQIAGVEPRISARYQNVFSSIPRYTLIALHQTDRGRDVVLAENLPGQPLMSEVHTLVCAALNLEN